MSTRKFWFCVVPVLTLALAGRAEADCEAEYWSSGLCMGSSHTESTYTIGNVCAHEIKVRIVVTPAGNDMLKTMDAAVHETQDDGTTVIDAVYLRGTVSTGQTVQDIHCCSDHSSCDHITSGS